MRAPVPFKRITIIGLGLIGGSLGLAIRKHLPGTVITGFDRPRVLSLARKRGAIHVAGSSLARAVEGADLVILAAPLDQIQTLLPTIARLVPPTTLVTDVGSVKGSVMARARRLFPRGNFVGGHPMTGAEQSGIRAAHPLLFENAIHVLTPLARAPLRPLANLIRRIGGRPLKMDPGTHDAVAAVVSHVPQLVAVGLMNLAGRGRGVSQQALRLGAGGFRDLTRIASSPFTTWSGILPANRSEVVGALRRLEQVLAGYRRALLRDDLAILRRQFRRSGRLRNRIPKDMKGFLHPLAILEVFIPDKPGMLAKLTAALARRRVNIKDIELMKVREGTGGTFRLSFESEEEKRMAAAILRSKGFSAG